MAHILRESSSDREDRVTVVNREDGYVWFRHETDPSPSGKLDRLSEADFDARYVDESTLRLEEGG